MKNGMKKSETAAAASDPLPTNPPRLVWYRGVFYIKMTKHTQH